MKNLANAAIDGLLFALVIWGVVSIFGPLGFVRGHHLTEALVFIGLIYACGSHSGARFGKGFWFR